MATMLKDSIEELNIYGQGFLNLHTVRFVRTAGNNVMLFLDAEPMAVIKAADQTRLTNWFARKVAESENE